MEITRCSRRMFLFISACGIAFFRILGQTPESWRLKHRFVNRYEGLIDLHTNQVNFEVVSFTASQVSFGRGTVLRVGVFSPVPAQVVIYAHEVEVSQQYWMETMPFPASAMRWTTFGPWPANDVLVPTSLDPSNLAVIARPSNTPGLEVLPSVVYTSEAIEPKEIVRYQIYMRSKYDLKEVKYRVSSVAGRQSTPEKILPISPPAGVPFVLEPDVSNLPDGACQLTVAVNNDNGKLDPFFVHFYHRRSGENPP